MAISALDPYYRAETTPVSVYRIGAALCAAYNQPDNAFGAKGNLAHASGYHRSRRWILSSVDSRYGDEDYSVSKPLDRGGADNDVSAFDFTPGVWGTPDNRRRMVEITARVYAAAKAGDPRLSNLREFAGTLDGRTVVTFNCADGSLKGPFDISHLDHVHGSFWRSRAANNHAGIIEVMLGAPTTGDEMKALVRYSGDPSGAVFLTDFVTAKWVRSEAELDDYRTLSTEGALPLAYDGRVRVLGRRELVGVIVGDAPQWWQGRPGDPVPVPEV